MPPLTLVAPLCELVPRNVSVPASTAMLAAPLNAPPIVKAPAPVLVMRPPLVPPIVPPDGFHVNEPVALATCRTAAPLSNHNTRVVVSLPLPL